MLVSQEESEGSYFENTTHTILYYEQSLPQYMSIIITKQDKGSCKAEY